VTAVELAKTQHADILATAREQVLRGARPLDRPRHVEAQVLADHHGNVVVVGTNDADVIRRSLGTPLGFRSAANSVSIHRVCTASWLAVAG